MPQRALSELFWADQLAQQVIGRKNFAYLKKSAPKISNFAIKTSVSASGVLHIGRLAEVIRNEAIARALVDAGKKVKFIMTADDMDPLRKIPRGIADGYAGYIGAPVTDVPDPDPKKCHESYAEHFVHQYIDVVREFSGLPIKFYSMREEYRKGNFNPLVKKIMAAAAQIVEIQNKHRPEKDKLSLKTWSPWRPICENCGKIITPRVHEVYTDGHVYYVCEDYIFETTEAKGCGHKGIADPLKGEGKLAYKSEWAVQWARWKINAEASGKEYQVPGSAYWINAEIVEKVLGWPAPMPAFFEHLFIDGKKMSASLGNIVYPHQWLDVAPHELLRYFFNKRITKTRSFSWSGLPELYKEYDEAAGVFFKKIKVPNEKEARHIKRLYQVAQTNPRRPQPLNPLPFSHAVVIAQLLEDEKKIIASLKRTGHYAAKLRKEILGRIGFARNWVKNYAPPQYKFVVNEKVPVESRQRLSGQQLAALKALQTMIRNRKYTEEQLYTAIKELAKREGIAPLEFFRGAYIALLNKAEGPPLATLIKALGQEKVAAILGTL